MGAQIATAPQIHLVPANVPASRHPVVHLGEAALPLIESFLSSNDGVTFNQLNQRGDHVIHNVTILHAGDAGDRTREAIMSQINIRASEGRLLGASLDGQGLTIMFSASPMLKTDPDHLNFQAGRMSFVFRG